MGGDDLALYVGQGRLGDLVWVLRLLLRPGPERDAEPVDIGVEAELLHQL